jgi:hypothetical protein
VVAGAREAHPVEVGCSHPVLPCPCMSAVRFVWNVAQCLILNGLD